ncbi:hypothetical protein NDU88_001259 [Pleurodeles waltl]|uniref:Uncharacterized protein n=1 Tax=Pleurodeles waltl TaxID=8319 RepID=A0AAV7LYU2_PLEWA|nr:hypothetical protein NDU88_001259 [Pleurodeles waltl]
MEWSGMGFLCLRFISIPFSPVIFDTKTASSVAAHSAGISGGRVTATLRGERTPRAAEEMAPGFGLDCEKAQVRQRRVDVVGRALGIHPECSLSAVERSTNRILQSASRSPPPSNCRFTNPKKA